MPYEPKIVEWLQSEAKFCYCCGMPFTKLDYIAIHSSTGLHLALCEVDNPVRYAYKVTDPPEAFKNMKGTILELTEFNLGKRYEGDAVAVCKNCHKKIHALALELCRERIPGFKGNTPLPRILHDATHNYNRYVRRSRLNPR